MPLLTPRQADIIALARDTGRLDVDSLTTHFGVTPQTIRKDLNQLCEQGLLQRYHGGAMLPSGVANLAYEARRQLGTDAKRRIGLRAARLIPNDCSLLINIGTTTEQVATALRAHTGLMVITNNINVVNILQGYTGIEVIVVGGVVRHADGGIVGEAAVDFIRQFKVDYAVVGASAIDEDGTLLDYDYREVKVSRMIVEESRRVILVADSSKYGRSAPGPHRAHLGDPPLRDGRAAAAAPPAPLRGARRRAGHRGGGRRGGAVLQGLGLTGSRSRGAHRAVAAPGPPVSRAPRSTKPLHASVTRHHVPVKGSPPPPAVSGRACWRARRCGRPPGWRRLRRRESRRARARAATASGRPGCSGPARRA